MEEREVSLTEREKEIALESWGIAFDKRLHVAEMFDLFLSRIREEQEVAAEIIPFTGVWLYRYYPDGTKFFTIPPAPAPSGNSSECDCSELVEALNKVMPACVCANQARRIIANHAKRMKGEE